MNWPLAASGGDALYRDFHLHRRLPTGLGGEGKGKGKGRTLVIAPLQGLPVVMSADSNYQSLVFFS